MNQVMTGEKFIALANIVLGALAGFLISGPLLNPERSALTTNLLVTIAFTALGAIAGIRRRHSRGFLYVSLICVLVLSSLMLRAFTQLQP